MKSRYTILKETTKSLYHLGEYLLWLIFDPSKFQKIRKKDIKKILIIHLGAIGELLISTPLLPALKKSLGSEIHYLVSPGKEPIFKNNPYISKVLTYRKDFKENTKMLKKEKFDMAIILAPGNWKIGLMCLKAGIKYRIGCFSGIRKGPAFFLTKRVFPLNKKHVIHKNLNMIRQIGVDNKDPKVEFYISKKEKQSAARLLKKLKINKYVIIHPVFGFSSQSKYSANFWPSERYAKVADYIIENYPFKVLITGNKDEMIFSENIMRHIKNKNKVIATNGMFSFGELGYVLSRARLLITTSTGVKHLAEAFNIPIVELAGKGTFFKNPNKPSYYEWQPWVDNYIILYHDEVCTGCNALSCFKKTQECMLAIKPEEVIKAAKVLLKGKK